MLAPLGRENPYIYNLAESVRARGIGVSGIGMRTWFILRALKNGLPDVLHLHWLHVMVIGASGAQSVVKRTVFLAQLRLMRLLGVKVVWTAHNLKDHECRFPEHDRCGHERVLLVPGRRRSAELKAIAGCCDCVLTGRMHLAIAALGMGVPVACITYQGKFEGLFRHFGMKPQTLAPRDACGPDALGSLIEDTVARRQELADAVAAGLPAVQQLSARNILSEA